LSNLGALDTFPVVGSTVQGRADRGTFWFSPTHRMPLAHPSARTTVTAVHLACAIARAIRGDAGSAFARPYRETLLGS